MACTVGKVCTCTLLMTVCSTSDLYKKHAINSLNSIQWDPRILCNTSKGTWGTEGASLKIYAREAGRPMSRRILRDLPDTVGRVRDLSSVRSAFDAKALETWSPKITSDSEETWFWEIRLNARTIRSKRHMFPKWLQHDSWIRFLDFHPHQAKRMPPCSLALK